MLINRNHFLFYFYFLEEDIDFSKKEFDGVHIRKIDKCHVRLTGDVFDNLFVLQIEITASVIVPSAYTLKDINLDLHFSDVFNISCEDEEDDEIFYEPNDIFDVEPYILSAIIAEVPMVNIAKDEKLPEDGKGYRILSEDDYLEEQKKKVDSRWSKLDDIDLG